MNKKRISIKDIAAAAGVSHPTVSRALRGEGRMADETRTRILDLAQDLGYTPSLVARGLVMQQTNTVGLVVTNYGDPFHAEVAHGIEDEARRNGYSLYIASTEIDPVRELEIVRAFQGRQVDGILVSSGRVGREYGDLLRETGIPLVLINAQADDATLNNVSHDDFGGAAELVRLLVRQGHRRIAYAGNSLSGLANSERLRAWRSALQDAGLEPVVYAIGPNGGLQGGVIAAEMLLAAARAHWNALPDAIVTYNDTMAIGILRFLREQGLTVPDDLSVTGFDDIEIAGYLFPPLTTWRQPRYGMGATAMRMMLGLIEATWPASEKHLVMRGELVNRGSTRLRT